MLEHNLEINSRGSRLVPGGCMNENQFMGLQIKVENGELVNIARQSIRGAPDSLVEDA